MTFSAGRSVGRVSIRVVPDVSKFRGDLVTKLKAIQRTTDMSVRVTRANVDSRAIKNDIQRQLDGIDLSGVQSGAAVRIDRAEINHRKMQQSIQSQLSRFEGFKANLAAQVADKAKFERDIRHLVDTAERHQVDIPVAVTTAIANARLAYTARTRFVTLVVRVSQASIVKTMATLAALSGARLTWKWLDDLLTKLRDLDKTLPSIVGWTSGITGLIAALTAATGGLFGIGQGLVSILPAFLVLPGLFINAAGSLTVLFVALKHAKDELSLLSDDMNELGGIIRTTFWDNAREPIIQLVNGLMPQLRNSFHELASGVGEFTGALADAFGRSLGNGRLESIFGGIAEGWRVLATGADGFAGALVSLSQIAARYTPRLAGWFVRQANTFDAWLNSISNDGRLSAWMEDAIDSMYDLWDATRGVAGVFAGIWTAAGQAGSGGLKGFGEMMLEWRRIVNGADFQRGLSAVFRGSYAAMDAFGGAVEAIGRLFSDMPGQVERFIGSAGGFLGGLIEGIAQALNSTKFAIGLDGFSSGLDTALAGIKPSLQPIADTFGNFLGTLGDIAANLLPTATGALADLVPTVDSLFGTVGDVLPGLTSAVSSFVTDVAPALSEFAEALNPIAISVFDTLGTALSDIGPDIANLAEALSPALIAALSVLAEALKPLAELSTAMFSVVGSAGALTKNGLGWLFDDKELDKVADEIVKNGGWFGDIVKQTQNFDKDYAEAAERHANAYIDSLSAGVEGNTPAMIARWTSLISAEFDKNKIAGNNLWDDFVSADLPPEVVSGVQANLASLGLELSAGGGQSGRDLVNGIVSGVTGQLPALMAKAAGIAPSVSAQIPTNGLYNTGANMIGGMASGITQNAWRVASAAIAAADGAMVKVNAHLGIQSPSKKWAKEVGHWLPAGIAMGIDQNAGIVEKSARAAVDFGLFDDSGASRAGIGGTVNHNTITMPLLPGETPQEQRDNLGRELRLVLGG